MALSRSKLLDVVAEEMRQPLETRFASFPNWLVEWQIQNRFRISFGATSSAFFRIDMADGQILCCTGMASSRPRKVMVGSPALGLAPICENTVKEIRSQLFAFLSPALSNQRCLDFIRSYILQQYYPSKTRAYEIVHRDLEYIRYAKTNLQDLPGADHWRWEQLLSTFETQANWIIRQHDSEETDIPAPFQDQDANVELPILLRDIDVPTLLCAAHLV